jgi:hypothetical protein
MTRERDESESVAKKIFVLTALGVAVYAAVVFVWILF